MFLLGKRGDDAASLPASLAAVSEGTVRFQRVLVVSLSPVTREALNILLTQQNTGNSHNPSSSLLSVHTNIINSSRCVPSLRAKGTCVAQEKVSVDSRPFSFFLPLSALLFFWGSRTPQPVTAPRKNCLAVLPHFAPIIKCPFYLILFYLFFIFLLITKNSSIACKEVEKINN